jgi:hypothetical protein
MASVEFDLRAADTHLAKSVDDGVTTSLTFGHDPSVAAVVFPTAPFWVTLDPDDPNAREDVLVTSMSGAVATVVRGYRSTTGVPHRSGAKVRLAGGESRRIGCRLRRALGQSVAPATLTNISWDTEDEDTDGFHSTGATITIPAGLDGLYDVTIRANTSTLVGRTLIRLVPSSSIAGMPTLFRTLIPTSETDWSLSVAGIPLVAGDTFVVQVYHSNSGNLSWFAWMSCYRQGV